MWDLQQLIDARSYRRAGGSSRPTSHFTHPHRFECATHSEHLVGSPRCFPHTVRTDRRSKALGSRDSLDEERRLVGVDRRQRRGRQRHELKLVRPLRRDGIIGVVRGRDWVGMGCRALASGEGVSASMRNSKAYAFEMVFPHFAKPCLLFALASVTSNFLYLTFLKDIFNCPGRMLTLPLRPSRHRYRQPGTPTTRSSLCVGMMSQDTLDR